MPKYSTIQPYPSCRFHLAVNFPGLRRNEYSSQIINQVQDFLEQVPLHGNLAELVK